MYSGLNTICLSSIITLAKLTNNARGSKYCGCNLQRHYHKQEGISSKEQAGRQPGWDELRVASSCSCVSSRTCWCLMWVNLTSTSAHAEHFPSTLTMEREQAVRAAVLSGNITSALQCCHLIWIWMPNNTVTGIIQRQWDSIKAWQVHEASKHSFRQSIISMWKDVTWRSDSQIYPCAAVCYAGANVCTESKQATHLAEKRWKVIQGKTQPYFAI